MPFNISRNPKPPFVSSLPSSAADGQEIYYQADGTNGVIWHLRYRSGSSSSYKWEFIGGPPLTSASNETTTTGVNISNVTWSSIDGNDPTLTVPLAGDYRISHHAVTSIGLGGGTTQAIGLRYGATEPSLTIRGTVRSGVDTANLAIPMSADIIKTALTASTSITQRYYQDSGGLRNITRFGVASLSAVPVRVG